MTQTCQAMTNMLQYSSKDGIYMNLFSVINPFGVVFAVLLMLPHIIFRKTRGCDKSVYTNRAMLMIDRIGRFFSLFLMAFNIGVLEKGFPEPKARMERFWVITTAVLVLCYLIAWALFFKNESKLSAYLIISFSAAAVIFSGICQVKTLLFTAGIVYLIGELYLASKFFQIRK